MSVEVVRNALLDEKRRQLRSATVARKRVLLGLYRATYNPPSLGAPLSPISPKEKAFLEANDLEQGRYFDEASIAARDFPHHTATQPGPKAQSSALPSSPKSPVLQIADGSVTLTPNENAAESDGLDPVKAAAHSRDASRQRSTDRLSPLRIPGSEPAADGPSGKPEDILPATIDGAARTPQPGDQATDASSRPKTVHLPPKDVQERHLKEIQRSLEEERKRERREDEALHLGAALNGAELASSPSSTIGAHSTFTPKPLNQSPDTSPDVESRATRHIDVTSASSDDATFRAASAIGLKSNLGSSATRGRASSPEAQLRLEDEEAARVARERDSRVQHLPPKDAELTKDAQDFVTESAQAHQEALETNAEIQTDKATLLQGPDSSVCSKAAPDTIAVKPKAGQAPVDSSNDTEMTGVDELDHKPESHEVAVDGSASQKPGLDRMQTRVSSGAMRQRSVTEILGSGRPNLARQSTTGSAISTGSAALTPTSGRREKDVQATSTALIPRRDSNKMTDPLRAYSDDYARLKGASQDETKDYLVPLFMYQAHAAPRARSLHEMVHGASKTVTTLNLQAMLREAQDYRILKRIYQLQNANRWSFRQMDKCREPPCPSSHYDHLLSEMKWMRTDFREERKSKAIASRNLAVWCAEWVAADAEARKSLQVKVKALPAAQDSNLDLPDDIEAPPELVPSGANETDSEASLEEPATITSTAVQPPSGLFLLGFDEVSYQLSDSPRAEALLEELPTYKPRKRTQSQVNDPTTIPVSKLLSGKLISKAQGPPRKRSRYEYEEEDSDRTPSTPKRRSSEEGPYSFTPTRRTPKLELPADETDLALFLPENKHVRDRLHAGHAFRPPSEFGMPSTSFFESRSSSHWLWKEDQELRTLVKEYSFNWSLISAEMAIPSRNTSGAERRTPWECFERWVQLEGLPAEMSKTQYFRTYQARLEAAARTVAQQHAAQQQAAQVQTPGAIQTIRKRTTQPFRVDRRKNSKYLAAIDGMRKLARKRETQAAKQQENARAAQLRKAAEQHQPKAQMQTPAEFSRLRHERDVKLMERQEQARQQWLQAQQRNANIQRQMAGQPQAAQQAAMQAAAVAAAAAQQQQQRNGAQPGTQANSQQAPLASAMQNGQMQQNNNVGQRMQGQHPMQNGMPNGAAVQANMQMPGMQGVPQAQMQAILQQQRVNSPENVRMMMQQRQLNAAAQQQAQAMQGLPSQNLANAHLAGGFGIQNLQNAQLMKQMAQAGFGGNNNNNNNGMGSNMMANMPSASPQGQQQRPQQLSNGTMPIIKQLILQIRANDPNITEAQAMEAAGKMLRNQTARQNALNAAAGASNSNIGANNNNSNNNNMAAVNMNMGVGMGVNMGMGMNGMSGMPMGFGGATSPGSMSVPMNMPSQGSHGPGSLSPVQHYNQNIRMQQQQQAPQRQMASSPAMGMSNMANSRSATPSQAQHQRMGSGNALENSLSPGGGRPGSMHGSVGGNG